MKFDLYPVGPDYYHQWRKIYINREDVLYVIEEYRFTEQVSGRLDRIKPDDFRHDKVARVKLKNGDEFIVWDSDRTAYRLVENLSKPIIRRGEPSDELKDIHSE